jgi:unsaturated rhamnogalacturonyl hydrolase
MSSSESCRPPAHAAGDAIEMGTIDLGGTTPLQWSCRVAQSAVDRLGQVLSFGQPRATLDYPNDLFAMALLALAERTGDAALRGYGEDIVGSFVAPDGSIRDTPAAGFKLDAMPAGMVLLDIHGRTGDDRYHKAAAALRARLEQLPRTRDGVFSWAAGQIWLDGLWMTQPFYARWAMEAGQPKDFNDILGQFQQVRLHNFDPATGLYRHGWDETGQACWADPATGRSASVWARALGWYAMALVDVLDAFPRDHAGHGVLVELLKELATALLRWQDPASGLWWQVVDQGARRGNYTESSASAMFVRMLAKGARQGYLPATVSAVALKGLAGLVRDKLVPDAEGRWSLIDTVRSAGLGPPPTHWPPGVPAPSHRDSIAGGRDGSFDYYVQQPRMVDNLHGLGPFVLAGLEVDALLA